MSAIQDRLQFLLECLSNFELRVPEPHERPIVEVAKSALAEEIRVLERRLHGDYWRPQANLRHAMRA
ncbi:MAG: hypothetical protein KDC98_09160 [Planctomycetes bacterium]|nr:hypothetical protein [Planctomycetota bacterium]